MRNNKFLFFSTIGLSYFSVTKGLTSNPVTKGLISNLVTKGLTNNPVTKGLIISNSMNYRFYSTSNDLNLINKLLPLTRDKAFKGIPIIVKNLETDKVIQFSSKSEAALAYNLSIRTLSRRCEDGKIFEFKDTKYTVSTCFEFLSFKQDRLSIEDRSILSKNLNLNNNLLSLITGMQLGDSHISLSTNSINARIHILQKDKEFVEFIWSYFNELDLVNITPLKNKTYDNRTNKTYTRYLFASLALPYFTELHKKWYKKELINEKESFIKIIPTNIIELLTPRALAFWLASDGSYHKLNGSITIHTDSFSIEEIKILQNAILINFNIKVTINNKRPGQYTLRFSKFNVPELRKIVISDFPPSLLYRLGL